MPRMDHRISIEQRLTRVDHAVLGLIRELANILGARLEPPLFYSESDILRMLEQQMRAQRRAEKG